MRERTVLLIALAFGTACGGHSPIAYDYRREPDPRRSEFVLGVGDDLAIRVWNNPDLSTDVVVRSNGTITLPAIGDLMAAGRTPTTLRKEIKRQLSGLVSGAEVTVTVTAIASLSFTVSGNVQHAGEFMAARYVTVLDAIQLAGGPNLRASPERLKLLRKDGEGHRRVIPINYRDLLSGMRPDANLPLLPGDELYMP